MRQTLQSGLTFALDCVVLDCENARELAAFYARLLGWPLTRDKEDFSAMRSPDNTVTLFFQSEPDYERPVWPNEPGKQQMSVHIDFSVNDLDAAVAHALSCGAKLAPVQFLEKARVCLDPAGHPFCLCAH